MMVRRHTQRGSRGGALRAGVVSLLVLLAGAGPGRATVVEWLMLRDGLDPEVLRPAPSVRLAGMGNPDLVMIDEASEMNLHDFAGNVAGVWEDSDRWVAESWLGNFVRGDDGAAMSGERRFGHAGLLLLQRSAARALGLEVNWIYLETGGDPGDWARARGPLISLLLNQRVGAFTLGFKLGQESENEDRISDSFFSIRHRQDRLLGRLGARAEGWGWVLGGEWRFEDGDVLGMSADPSRFHEDSFVWARPANRYVFSLIRPRTGNLEGGVRVSLLDRRGGERVAISWSDRSPQNPGGTNYFLDAVTFAEEEGDREIAARGRLYLGDAVCGAEASYRDWDFEVVEGTNFKGSESAAKRSDQALEGRAGVSAPLIGRRLVACLETRLVQADWEAREDGLRTAATRGLAMVQAGAEYFLNERLALRAGVGMGSEDRDLDAPLTRRSLRALSGGFSWMPRGGLVQVHGALSQVLREPEDADSPLIKEQETGFALSLRLLL